MQDLPDNYPVGRNLSLELRPVEHHNPHVIACWAGPLYGPRCQKWHAVAELERDGSGRFRLYGGEALPAGLYTREFRAPATELFELVQALDAEITFNLDDPVLREDWTGEPLRVVQPLDLVDELLAGNLTLAEAK